MRGNRSVQDGNFMEDYCGERIDGDILGERVVICGDI